MRLVRVDALWVAVRLSFVYNMVSARVCLFMAVCVVRGSEQCLLCTCMCTRVHRGFEVLPEHDLPIRPCPSTCVLSFLGENKKFQNFPLWWIWSMCFGSTWKLFVSLAIFFMNWMVICPLCSAREAHGGFVVLCIVSFLNILMIMVDDFGSFRIIFWSSYVI